ncbi:MAG: hypothetical protein A2Z47_01505 [Thermodesulfovibrio sp. RBG_19FT_COMBO_42_12]|nr:MAG: hypothetical protein A2Z47_01505 [Thermodesulfovibrio sp. RBG_19FT_COMBO_42_12]
MRKIFRKLEDLMVAATYAEAGEFETAQEILRENDRPQKVDRISPTQRIRKELKAPGIQR